MIECAYALCDVVVDDYESLSQRMMRAIRLRCRPSTPAVDEEDCGAVGECLKLAYGIKLYLRQLYLLLRGQSFDVNDESSIRYIGSRQQCLYRCVCFVVMFFEAYDNFDAIGMKNVDWLMCSALD